MSSQTKLVWLTGNAEHLIAQCARVSSSNPENPEIEKLLKYMINHKHWSPFEMVHACFEINCSRAIARQILRHRSFSFQEFSQRYADPAAMHQDGIMNEARKQDPVNRQSSISVPQDHPLQEEFDQAQADIWSAACERYKQLIADGLAKECARVLLPEGMTASRMYMVGSIRSWLHYLEVRLDTGTQKEHREIAQEIHATLAKHLPITFNAFGSRNL